MAESVPGQRYRSQVAVAARIRAFSATPPSPHDGGPPFDHALPNWLEAITPLGADVLHTNQAVVPLTAPDWISVRPASELMIDEDAAGRRRHTSRASRDAYKPRRHPSEAPRSEQRLREERIAEAWRHAHALCLALRNIGIGRRSTDRGSLALAETALWLAGPTTREPGVPIHGQLALDARSRLSSRAGNLLRGARWGRNGAHILRIECAASHDLAAAPFAQLSRAQGWQDHEDFDGRPAGASSAKRAVREGRLLLHRLGAWPWAHAESGRLHEHPEWWRQPRFLNPLRLWLAQSWGRAMVSELARHRAALTLEPSAGTEAQASAVSARVLEDAIAEIAVALEADRDRVDVRFRDA